MLAATFNRTATPLTRRKKVNEILYPRLKAWFEVMLVAWQQRALAKHLNRRKLRCRLRRLDAERRGQERLQKEAEAALLEAAKP